MMWTISTAARAMREGRLSAVALLEECLAAIEAREKSVRAWVVVDSARARSEAERADAERAKGVDRGELHGIPLGIKDIIDVFDLPTACGSVRWKDAYARADAPVVARLRHAGAVIVGKTVTTAYASFDPPPTRNPHDLSRTPGGSSSGSAAAVASGMCLGSLGTQTGGSITRPASYCGVAACKPSLGFATTAGVLPLAHSLDHVGPMAMDVAGCAALMRAYGDIGFDVVQVSKPPTLGRLGGFFERYASAEVRELFDRVCRELSGKGATIVAAPLPASFEEVSPRHRTVMAVEAAMYHRERLARYPDDYPPCVTQLLREGIATPAPEYAACKEHQRRLREEMHAVAFHGAGYLICPATTTDAPDAVTTGDPAFNSPWSYTGLPAASFVVARSRGGLPLCVQVVGRHGDDAGVLAAAMWCEGAMAAG